MNLFDCIMLGIGVTGILSGLFFLLRKSVRVLIAKFV